MHKVGSIPASTKAIPRNKGKYRSKEFTFTRLLKCGSCGYGITAVEKFKNLKDGSRRRYVYCHCTNKGPNPCREPYIREESLITQLIALIQEVAINSDTAASKLKSELERFTAFSRGVLGQTQEIHLKTNDEELRNYLLYLLTNGNREDKHEVLALLESKLYLKDEIIQLR